MLEYYAAHNVSQSIYYVVFVFKMFISTFANSQRARNMAVPWFNTSLCWSAVLSLVGQYRVRSALQPSFIMFVAFFGRSDIYQ